MFIVLLKPSQLHCGVLFFVLTILISSCSSSGGEQSSTVVANTNITSAIDTEEETSSAVPSADSVTSGDSTLEGGEEQSTTTVPSDNPAVTSDGDSASDVQLSDASRTEPEISESTAAESESATTVSEAQPSSPTTTVVEFEITVPAYMSNELQLNVQFNGKTVKANWVGDELWTASDTVPINTTQQVYIEFSDSYGDTLLGFYSVDIETGVNPYQLISVSADKFNTDEIDADGDGVSNLSELIAGTDPNVFDKQLEIVDNYFDKQFFILDPFFGSPESVLAAVSIYEENLSDLPFYLEESNKLINFDENGTGTYSSYSGTTSEPGNTTSIRLDASRTNTGNSILYDATWKWFNSSAARGDNRGTITDTQVVDESSRIQTAELYRNESGTGSDYREEIKYTLTGQIVEGTRHCEPSYGELSYEHSSARVDSASVTKSVDDEYWHVIITARDDSVVEEYLARNLGRRFYCDMVGL